MKLNFEYLGLKLIILLLIRKSYHVFHLSRYDGERRGLFYKKIVFNIKTTTKAVND